MDNIKVSVIIPVYNTESYVEQCLNSVTNQTLKNIEIIVVNDGSTDNSIDIIDEFKKKYNNIIYIYQENSGQGKARNQALEICRGEYIDFIDSDDFIDVKMLENLYREASNNKLDVLIFKLVPFYEKLQIDRLSNSSCKVNKIYNRDEIIKKFLTNYEVEGFSCNKFIRREIFKNNKIQYPLKMKYEDIPAMLDVIINSGRFGITQYAPYYYRQRLGSSTNSYNLANIKDYIKSFYMVRDMIKKIDCNNKFKDDISYYFFVRIVKFYFDNYTNLSDIKVKKFMKHTIDKTIDRKMLLNRNIKFKIKLKYIVCRTNCIEIYFHLKKLYNKLKN